MLVVLVLLAHLAPYAVRPSVIHLRLHFHALARKQFLQITTEDAQTRPVFHHVIGKSRLYGIIFVRTTIFEGEVLKVSLHVEESEAIGKRSVEIVSLACYLHLLVGAHGCQRAHVVQTVGNLYHQGTYVVMQRVEQLLIVVELLRHAIFILLLLRHHIDQECHVLTKHVTYLVNGVLRVFHDIVKEGTDDGVDIQSHLLSGDLSHSHGVYYIRCATLAVLIFVSFLCKGIGMSHTAQVFLTHPQRQGFYQLVDTLVEFLHVKIFRCNIRNVAGGINLVHRLNCI